MVNSHKIAQVEIARRDDPIGEDGKYVYDWCVATDRDGTVAVYDYWTDSGDLKHKYSDGAFVLVQKVLAAYLSH